MRGAFPQRAAAAASARAEPLEAGARAGAQNPGSAGAEARRRGRGPDAPSAGPRVGHGDDVRAALGACAR
jgi:hypothetical protein